MEFRKTNSQFLIYIPLVIINVNVVIVKFCLVTVLLKYS